MHNEIRSDSDLGFVAAIEQDYRIGSLAVRVPAAGLRTEWSSLTKLLQLS